MPGPSAAAADVRILALTVFVLALCHTFAAGRIERFARRSPRHAGLLHPLGEVEIVFGLWAIVLLLVMAAVVGGGEALRYAASRSYTEPLFVVVVMVVAASRPVLRAVVGAVGIAARALPLPEASGRAWLGLAAVPLLGSLITEPAAMTIAALMLAPQIFRPQVPERLKYLALGVLFVNVSIGGTLTAYAAPPVLMVAATWHWDSAFMLAQFGWKAAVAVAVNAGVATWLLRRHLRADAASAADPGIAAPVPAWVSLVHVAFLAVVVLLAHRPLGFVAVFVAFLGFVQATRRHQSPPIFSQALKVGFFLAGLVVLGGLQRWWLQPLITGLEPLALFFGAVALTAVTDNAALTYLGSLVAGISEPAKVMLVAGAVAGGGLTVIANAPNPAGAALLKNGFVDGSVGVGGLFVGALAPTAVAIAAFLLL